MKYLRLINQAQIQLSKSDARIRAGLSGEGEFPVARLIQRYKGQGRELVFISNDAPVSIPALCKVEVSSFPKASVPTFPSSAVLAPNFARAAKKFAGAPPGCAAIVGEPCTTTGTDALRAAAITDGAISFSSP